MGLRADGGQFPIEVSLTPVAGSTEGLVLAVVHQISARARAESALGAEGRVTDALDAIPEAVLITDAAGKLDFLNRSAEALTGRHHASARGIPVESILPLVDCEETVRSLSEWFHISVTPAMLWCRHYLTEPPYEVRLPFGHRTRAFRRLRALCDEDAGFRPVASRHPNPVRHPA
jgi:PAS domain-containing protein